MRKFIKVLCITFITASVFFQKYIHGISTHGKKLSRRDSQKIPFYPASGMTTILLRSGLTAYRGSGGYGIPHYLLNPVCPESVQFVTRRRIRGLIRVTSFAFGWLRLLELQGRAGLIRVTSFTFGWLRLFAEQAGWNTLRGGTKLTD
jgi:hypothetical protein